jgi:hypothetical protein
MRLITFAGGAVAVGAIVAVGVVLASSDSSDPPAPVSPSAKQRTKQQTRSRYLSLSQGREVRARTTLLRSRLVLRRRDSVFVQSDGTYAPLGRDAAASVFVEIDGRRVSNESMIDWRVSKVPLRHSFNAVGAAQLSKGTHRVKLVARPIAGAFAVSQSSNLSILVHPAERVSVTRLLRRAGPFDFVTSGRGGRGDRLPHKALASVLADTRPPTVALAAASAQRVGGQNGDAMLGIYRDHQHANNNSSVWTVNDLCICAELQAPFYTQALLRDGKRRSLVSLEATEYPWDQPGANDGEDTAEYIVQPSATLVVLGGGMRVVGKGEPDRWGVRKLAGTAWDWSCVGRGADTPRYCPNAGSAVRIASETFEVPRGHSGVVMFAAKSRVQAGRNDAGGTTKLWLVLDGLQRGSVGVQALAAPSTISQRTISTGYLAAGRRRLRPGKHTIEVFGRVQGSFASVSLSRDLPLIWFD